MTIDSIVGVDVTYVFSSHTLDEDFGVLIDEDMWHGLLRVDSPVKGVNQRVLLRGDKVGSGVVNHSSLDES